MNEANDEELIHALFERGDHALVAADIDTLADVFAEDYVQYDASGQPFPKREVLKNLHTAAVRYPKIESTGRKVRIFGDMAIVHGSETDEVEAGGERTSVRYLYMDVCVKRGGHWQIVGSQLVIPTE
jgi:uncharacterized protein (TIGR02246 family)